MFVNGGGGGVLPLMGEGLCNSGGGGGGGEGVGCRSKSRSDEQQEGWQELHDDAARDAGGGREASCVIVYVCVYTDVSIMMMVEEEVLLSERPQPLG